MKEKSIILVIEKDVAQIECELTNADVIIEAAQDGVFKVEFPNAKNVHAGNGEDGLFISQKRRAIFVNAKQEIKISVPAHDTPSLKLCGKTFSLTVNGGIYGDLGVSAEDGNVTLKNCSFANADILGGEVNVFIGDVTVKGALNLHTDKGNVISENGFATRAECRIKRGNVGIVNATCKDCSIETLKGNVTATMTGSEEDFSFELTTQEGTANRESTKREAADNNFRAYTRKGNLVLDFTQQKENG